jgi:hypothetical protein
MNEVIDLSVLRLFKAESIESGDFFFEWESEIK